VWRLKPETRKHKTQHGPPPKRMRIDPDAIKARTLTWHIDASFHTLGIGPIMDESKQNKNKENTRKQTKN
jgi:hypothetical protein